MDWATASPSVILLVGVNGSGKTTTAAKLGKRFSNEGKKYCWQPRIHTVLPPLISFRYGQTD